MTDKQQYQQKLQAQLDEWNAQVDLLKARAEKASADAKIQLDDQISEIQSRQKEAKQRLNELQNASDNAWEDLRSGVENAWKALGNAVESAASRFR